MVSQHGILLAAGLISDHFGPLVAVRPLPASYPPVAPWYWHCVSVFVRVKP